MNIEFSIAELRIILSALRIYSVLHKAFNEDLDPFCLRRQIDSIADFIGRKIEDGIR